MLQIKKLSCSVEWKMILKAIDIDFELGKTYFLLWKNWSWKSSLSFTIAWHPKYKVESWDILLDEISLKELSPDKINSLGIFLSFQNIPEIPWIKLKEFLRTIYNYSAKNKNPEEKDISPFMFSRIIKKYLDELSIPEWFLDRDLNVWFSWWEKRKIELLQIKLLKPKYVIFDEIDSWLDIDAFRIVSQNIGKMKDENTTFIFITHNFNLMEFVDVDYVYVLEKWQLADKWWKELADKIKVNGYCSYCNLSEWNCDFDNKCI